MTGPAATPAATVVLPPAALADLAAIRWWVRLYGVIGLALLGAGLLAATLAGLSAYGLLDLPAPPGYRWFWQRSPTPPPAATPSTADPTPAPPVPTPAASDRRPPRRGGSGAA